ncbi:hypothetical protein, partial [Campylobacter jejuni]|uniref:hypothetical protein n=1 Tax=Campylobacter jejuni TaxID=197 RepID=UPI003FA53592
FFKHCHYLVKKRSIVEIKLIICHIFSLFLKFLTLYFIKSPPPSQGGSEIFKFYAIALALKL